MVEVCTEGLILFELFPISHGRYFVPVFCAEDVGVTGERLLTDSLSLDQTLLEEGRLLGEVLAHVNNFIQL